VRPVRPVRLTHRKRNKFCADASSRYVRKNKYGNRNRERDKHFGGPPETNEKILTALGADTEGR